ncbi:hypothetical protein D3C81_1671830 [compost metagenome]
MEFNVFSALNRVFRPASLRVTDTLLLTWLAKSTSRMFTVPDCEPLTLAAKVLNTDSSDFFAASTPEEPMLPEVSTMKAML